MGNMLDNTPCGNKSDGTDFEKQLTLAKKMTDAQCKEAATKMAKAFISKYDFDKCGTLNKEESTEMCK